MGAARYYLNYCCFGYDLVNVNRQVLANHAAALHREMARACEAKDAQGLDQASRRFLELIHDLDQLLATRREFLLGGWLEDAKRWGTTDAERERFQWNAGVLTLWGQGPAINDYARKHWSGMLDGYYGPRWQRYLDARLRSLRTQEPFHEEAFHKDLWQWMADWSDGQEQYPTEPRGDRATQSRSLWQKYGPVLR